MTGLSPLVEKYPNALGEPRQAARFLCGITSPQLTTAKLSRNGLFGCCSAVPFATVLQACESHLASSAERSK